MIICIYFISAERKWNTCDPIDLFQCPVLKGVPEKNKEVASKFQLKEENLEKEARDSQCLVLWLDCDREGENISFEVIEIIRKINSNIRIYSIIVDYY